MGRIFISYSRRDTETVDRVVDSMCNAGLEVWLDRHDIQAGNTSLNIHIFDSSTDASATGWKARAIATSCLRLSRDWMPQTSVLTGRDST